MYLTRKELYKLVGLLKDFPEVEKFEVEQTGHSGIGSITSVSFEQDVGGHKGSFKIELSGVEDW